LKREPANTPVSAATVMQQLLNKFGLSRGYSRHQALYLWPKIVNPTIARHARIEKLAGNTIHVAVDSSVWMSEMASLKSVLLQKVNACLHPKAAQFEEIRFFQRSSFFPAKESGLSVTVRTLDPREQQKVRALLEPLRNEDIRSLMNRILEKDLQLKDIRKRKNTIR